MTPREAEQQAVLKLADWCAQSHEGLPAAAALRRYAALLAQQTPDKELVICSAIRMPDGYIIRGHRHNDALNVAAGMPRYERTTGIDVKQGFVTSTGRFVDRYEAHLLHFNGTEGQLYSEDLY